jgi:hypothetical protein
MTSSPLQPILKLPPLPSDLAGLAGYRAAVFAQTDAAEALLQPLAAMGEASLALLAAQRAGYAAAKAALADDALFKPYLDSDVFGQAVELEGLRMESALREAVLLRRAVELGCAGLKGAPYEDLLPWLTWRSGCFPYEAVAEARSRRLELAPRFQAELTALQFKPQDGEGCAEALLLGLLAQWGEADALGLLLARLRDSRQKAHPDGWDEWFQHASVDLMAALARTQPQRVLDLAMDLKEDEALRGTALEAWLPLLRHGHLRRETLLEALRRLQASLGPGPAWDWTGWADTALTVAPREFEAEIRAAIRQGRLDPSDWMNEEDVDGAVALGWEGQQAQLAEDRRYEAFDLERALAHEEWFWQEPDLAPELPADLQVDGRGAARRGASKVGRNEPCPCGSGKKFKKCHGV